MKIPLRTVASALLLVFAFCLLTLAQQPQPSTPQVQPSNQPKEPDYVNFSGFKGKIFEVKNRDPREIVPVITPLSSGFKGALITSSSGNKTITVRDFPENIATMEEAIKRLDVPPPPSPPQPPEARTKSADVEVTAYVLLASNSEASNDIYPALLKDVVKQLQATLNYKNYALLTPIVQRTNLGNGQIQSRGIAQLPDKTASATYDLQISRIALEWPSDPNSSIYFSNLQFSLRGSSGEDQRAVGEATISTRLNVRDGEKVVVGTASLKDKGLILVLTVKVIK